MRILLMLSWIVTTVIVIELWGFKLLELCLGVFDMDLPAFSVNKYDCSQPGEVFDNCLM